MHLLGDTIDRRPALPADSLCEAALAAFIHDPDCRCLAVVEGDRPVGVVHREAFLARMEAPGAPDRSIREALEPEPLIADAGEAAEPFVRRAMAYRPAAMLGGFIVTEAGAYAGVCDLGRLLPALTGGGGGGGGLVERICAEVREPVAHALAAAEGLRRLRLPDDAAGHLETIAEAVHATLALLDTAAELQRAEAGRLEIVAAPRRLQELMDEIEGRWRIAAEASGVTLLVSYDGAPDCAAMIDSGRLMQVFDALVGQALAQSRRGVVEASLQVRPAAERGFVLVGRVRDNGASYAPGDFAAMLQGVAGFDAGGSLQLQLMLAQRAIAAMSGRLEAKANAGCGATVSFELRVEAADAGETQATDTAAPPSGRAAHILVVDDNATNRMVVEALCEMFDCSTESVIDGLEAVEAAKAGRYDVILMDIKMPRMDGVTATREIRKLPAPAGRVPIIALTANADADEVTQYLAAGMRCVVEKPIKPERLLEALDTALAERDAPAAAPAAAA